MAITTTDWLITSDVAHEVAFRVDVPEPEQGRWVLSYLPTSFRISREQALAGVVLAELILIGLLRPGGEFDSEVAALHAEILGLTVTDAMCLLALRVEVEPQTSELDGTWRQPAVRCAAPAAGRRAHSGRGVSR